VRLIVMPFLIWFAGSRVLGPYTHGQNAHAGRSLWLRIFLGAGARLGVFWAVALGPAVLLLLIRLFVALVRALPAPATTEATAGSPRADGGAKRGSRPHFGQYIHTARPA